LSSRWRIVDLTEYHGEVNVRHGHLIVGDADIPLADVSVVVVGVGTHWSGGVAAVLAKYDVPLLVLDWRGLPLSVATGFSGNSRVAARHLAQAALSLPRRKNGWMRIVKAKIAGQANNLEATFPDAAARMRDLVGKVRSGDPQNVEARAARTYWSTLFGGRGFSREPGGGSGLNALLDYGYAILRGVTIRAICVAGLSPTLSCHHRNRGNAFALADDLVEPFRPCVDHTVINLGSTATLQDRAVKEALVGVMKTPMAPGGESILATVNDFARGYARYVEGDERALKVPIWRGESG